MCNIDDASFHSLMITLTRKIFLAPLSTIRIISW